MVLSYRLISRLLKGKKLPTPSPQKAFMAETVEKLQDKRTELIQEIGITTLSPEAIIEKIKKAPLLQKPDFIKNFIGLRVDWKGTLAGAENIGKDLARIHIAIPGASTIFSVFLNIIPSRYPGNGLLEKGHPIRVSGKIAHIDEHLSCMEIARLLGCSKMTVSRILRREAQTAEALNPNYCSRFKKVHIINEPCSPISAILNRK